MAGETFDIVFTGRIVQGVEPARVRENVARLFKTEPAKVEHLFSGQRVFIKKGVDDATARTYLAALGKAGVIAEIVPATAAPKPQVPATPPAEPAAAGPVPPAAAPRRTGPPVAPDYTVAEPGVVLVEARTVPPVQIETAHLSLAEVGADLAERRAVPAPSYDLSGLALDPPGTLLVEPRVVPAPQIDTSALRLAD